MLRYWKTKEGKKLKICDMEDSHITNCIKMLENKLKELPSDNELDSAIFGVPDSIIGIISREYSDIMNRKNMLERYINTFKEQLELRSYQPIQ